MILSLPLYKMQLTSLQVLFKVHNDFTARLRCIYSCAVDPRAPHAALHASMLSDILIHGILLLSNWYQDAFVCVALCRAPNGGGDEGTGAG